MEHIGSLVIHKEKKEEKGNEKRARERFKRQRERGKEIRKERKIMKKGKKEGGEGEEKGRQREEKEKEDLTRLNKFVKTIKADGVEACCRKRGGKGDATGKGCAGAVSGSVQAGDRDRGGVYKGLLRYK